jgi:hypothetical protein
MEVQDVRALDLGAGNYASSARYALVVVSYDERMVLDYRDIGPLVYRLEVFEPVGAGFLSQVAVIPLAATAFQAPLGLLLRRIRVKAESTSL